MSYYTQRHGLRAPVEKTDTISVESYAILFNCCQNYFENLAWKYPEECPDGRGCCGLDEDRLNGDLKFEIPALFRNDSGVIDVPRSIYNIFSEEPEVDEYDQYALLDFIEFVFANVRDICRRDWHSFFKHDDIGFRSTAAVAGKFRQDINAAFGKTGLLYTLSEDGMVERIVETGVNTPAIEQAVEQIKEPGVRALLKEAILLYKSPAPQARQDSVEKIWDALERLKTYYTSMDKKSSAAKIVNDIAGGQAEYVTLFDEEFKALTKIGNNFRIRHHETDKIDITDARHYDYFFNRCLSLIALAIQYLV